MAFELQQSLAWLSDIEDADAIAVLGEGGKEMRVVWRSGEAEEGRGVRHCLLSRRWRNVARAIRCYSTDVSFV